MLQALAAEYKFSLETPFEKLSKKVQEMILYGTNGKEISVTYQGRNNRTGTIKVALEGVVNN